MSKIVQGGTVPALIWRDVMKVATEPYGKAEFNYPEVQLIPFAAGSNVKIIGGDDNAEKPKEEEAEKPVNLDEVTAVTPADVVKNANKKNTEPAAVTAPVVPKPAAPAKPAAAPIPVPMAVPESLH